MCRAARRKSESSPGGARGEPGDPGGDADAPAPSGHDGDSRMRTKDPRNTLERVEARSEQEEEENSPGRGPEGTDKPKRNPAARGDVNSHCEHPRDQ